MGIAALEIAPPIVRDGHREYLAGDAVPHVRGHAKVSTGGQLKVLAGGHRKVSTRN
jgi:hypothetical protein